jgi:XrtJ-associated TM-motif-TM protein
MKNSTRLSLLLSLFLMPALAHAQSGCTNSPECPTAILALAGMAGMGISSLRLRKRAGKEQ